MIETQNRQWQDNGKTMTTNMTKKTKNTNFWQISFSWGFNIFCHFSGFYVMILSCFIVFLYVFMILVCDVSCLTVFFNSLIFVDFPSLFIGVCHFSMGFFPFCFLFFFVGFLHVFIGFLLLCQMFSLFFLWFWIALYIRKFIWFRNRFF